MYCDPAIGVMGQLPGGRVSSAECHDEGVDDEIGRLAFAHRPAHDRLIVKVLDSGQVELAVPTGELGVVGDPPLIGPLGSEVPLEQVRCRGRVRLAAPPSSPAMDTDEAVLAHQPGDSLATDPAATMAKLAVDAWRAVGALRRVVDLDDLRGEHLVVEVTLRRCAC